MVPRTIFLAPLVLLSAASNGWAGELDGVWRVLAVESEAGKVDLPEPLPQLRFHDKQLLYGREVIAKVTVDEATTPRVLDLRFDDLDGVLEGIYAVEAKSLRICLNGRGDGVKLRPGDFSLVEQPARRVLHLERAPGEQAADGAGYLGAALGLNNERAVVFVQSVLENSPAKKAGLQAGDQLLAVDRMEIKSLQAAIDTVRQLKPGARVLVRIAREEKERDLPVVVGQVPFRILTGLD